MYLRKSRTRQVWSVKEKQQREHQCQSRILSIHCSKYPMAHGGPVLEHSTAGYSWGTSACGEDACWSRGKVCRGRIGKGFCTHSKAPSPSEGWLTGWLGAHMWAKLNPPDIENPHAGQFYISVQSEVIWRACSLSSLNSLQKSHDFMVSASRYHKCNYYWQPQYQHRYFFIGLQWRWELLFIVPITYLYALQATHTSSKRKALSTL